MLLETKQKLRRVTLPLARLLARMGVSPDSLTVTGLVLIALSAASLALGEPRLALLLLLLGLLCDLLDGDVARLRGGGGSFGAFLDSTVDRISDALIFTGLLLGEAMDGGALGAFWILAWALTVTGGFLVSYTRARAEGLGLTCRIGIADRGLRMAIVVAMVLLGSRAWAPGFVVLSVLSWITVGQRIRHVRRLTAGRPRPAHGLPQDAPPADRTENDRYPLAVHSK